MTTKIGWVKNADGTHGETWNPVVGCSHVSPGCDNCYAERMAGRLERMGSLDYAGLTRGGKWTGDVRYRIDRLPAPLYWRKPRTIFVCSMSDLFHPAVPFTFVDQVFSIMRSCPQHTFQVLTKRPERMRRWYELTPLAKICRPTWPLPNVWIGTTCEDQKRADERIPDLVATPAVIRFVSLEPMLGPVDLDRWIDPIGQDLCGECGSGECNGVDKNAIKYDDHGDGICGECGAPREVFSYGVPLIDQVIAGGETGAGARPCHPYWVRLPRDQCQESGVRFFFKQWGEWRATGEIDPIDDRNAVVEQIESLGISLLVKRIGKRAAGRILDGRTWDEIPEVQP